MNEQTNTAAGMLIAQMPEADRPREKALRNGIKSLTDAELMAIIFGTGIGQECGATVCGNTR